MSLRVPAFAFLGALTVLSSAQSDAQAPVDALRVKGLREMGAYSMLRDLTTNVGARKAGSPEAEKAVQWGKATMERLGFQNVRLIDCMVPRWVRGKTEQVTLIDGGRESKVTCCALGGSVGTGREGLEAEVVEVGSLEEVARLGDKAKGKIVFLNGPMDRTLANTFAAYGRAVGQRAQGAIAASKVGAVAVVVRSMTLDPDDVPHTGAMRYQDGVAKIPAAALSVVAAEKLTAALKKNPKLKVRLELSCQTFPDVPSANVVGELVGSEKPEEVIVVGGHLDTWDKGTGAHDNGAGITHSLEALRLIKELGWKPKRTIRLVMFMDEEFSGRGSAAYAAYAKTSGEKHIAAVESDSGGFAPRGFSSSLTEQTVGKVDRWIADLQPFGIGYIGTNGGGGADVEPLRPLGTVLFGLIPDNQRYFDYHHSDKDTLDKVNPRELELGALSIAWLLWRLSEEGI